MCKADPSLKFCYPSADSGGGSSSNGSSPATPPVMKMYFFNEMPFYLLFKSWTPRTSGDLLGAWLAIFFLGVLYEFLQMVYGKREAEFWANRAAVHTAAMAAAAAAASQRGMDEEAGGPLGEGVIDSRSNGSGNNNHTAAVYASAGGSSYGGSCCATTAPRPMSPAPKTCCGGGGGGASGSSSRIASPLDSAASFDLSKVGYHSKLGRRRGGLIGALSAYMQPDLVAMDVVRGVARFVLAGLAYLLMLAAMCFNVPIFFAVISGVGVGSMLFGRWRWNTGVAEGYSHCGCGSS